MFGTPFYHASIRTAVVAFGTLFNKIKIDRRDSSNNVLEEVIVPLSYGPRQKFLVRLEQEESTTGAVVQMSLPRMSFSMDSINYDPSRSLISVKKTASARTSSTVNRFFQRVPYILNFSLNIMVKNTEDGLKIIEQILPYFTPSFNVTVDDNLSPEGVMDLPFTLNSISQNDIYDGSFRERRVLTYNLSFTTQTYFYGPQVEQKIITKAITHLYNDQATGIKVITLENSGTGYSTSNNVSVLGGSGQGATVDITVASGKIIKVIVNTPGVGYKLGDVLTINSGNKNGEIKVIEEMQFDTIDKESPTSTVLDSANVRMTIVPDPISSQMGDDFGFTFTEENRE